MAEVNFIRKLVIGDTEDEAEDEDEEENDGADSDDGVANIQE